MAAVGASSCSNQNSDSDSGHAHINPDDIAGIALTQLLTEPDDDALVRLRARIARAITRLSMLRAELHRLQRQADSTKLQLWSSKLASTVEQDDLPRELLAKAAAASRGAAATRRRARKATAALCSKLRSALAKKHDLPQLTDDLKCAMGRANDVADARRKALQDTKKKCALLRRSLHAEMQAGIAVSNSDGSTSTPIPKLDAELCSDAEPSLEVDQEFGKLDGDLSELDGLARLAISREEADLLGRLRALTNQIDVVRADRERVQTETNIARAREAAVRAWRREMLACVGNKQSCNDGGNGVVGGETTTELSSNAAVAAISQWRLNSSVDTDVVRPRLWSCIAQDCAQLPPPPIQNWAPARLQRHACMDTPNMAPSSPAKPPHNASAREPTQSDNLQKQRDSGQPSSPNLRDWTVEVKVQKPTFPVTSTGETVKDAASSLHSHDAHTRTCPTTCAEYSICGW